MEQHTALALIVDINSPFFICWIFLKDNPEPCINTFGQQHCLLFVCVCNSFQKNADFFNVLLLYLVCNLNEPQVFFFILSLNINI